MWNIFFEIWDPTERKNSVPSLDVLKQGLDGQCPGKCAREDPCVGGNIMATLDVTSNKVSLRLVILGHWMLIFLSFFLKKKPCIFPYLDELLNPSFFGLPPV